MATDQTAQNTDNVNQDAIEMLRFVQQIIRNEVLAAVLESETLMRNLSTRQNIACEVQRLRSNSDQVLLQILDLARKTL